MKPIVKKVLIGVGLLGAILLVTKATKSGNKDFFEGKLWNGMHPDELKGRYPGITIANGVVTIATRPDLVGQIVSANLIRWNTGDEWVGV